MDIKCNKDDLVYSVGIANKAVPTKTTMPILECLLISATDKLVLSSNDTKIGIETTLEGEIIEQGKIAIDAKLFGDVVRKLPDGDVHIATDNTTAKVTCGKAKFNLPIRNADEFPYLETLEKNNGITLRQYDLKEIIRQTIFSAVTSENNKIMTGENFEISDKLKVTALDGHRIAMRSMDIDNESNIKMIIPAKTLVELIKILSDEGNVTIYSTESNVMFDFDNTVFTSRLIEGEYFDVSRMLQSDYTTTIKINKREFTDALDRATLLVKEIERKPVIFTIGAEMEIKIVTNIGSMNETLSIDKTGEDLTIGFNPRFLLDALRAIDDETVFMNFINSKSPCYIKDDAETYTYMVLPINFNQ